MKTIRGVRGGLTLDCDPHEVTLQEVIEALQGADRACRLVRSIVITAIVHQDVNSMRFGALLMCSWRNSFSSITLADLFEKGASHPEVSRILESKY